METKSPYYGMRLIPYGRVSMLGEGTESDADQFDKMQAFAERHGVTLVGAYDPDLDMTGTEFSKRKIKNHIATVDNGKADGVLVMRLSRWGRSDTENRVYEKALNDAGGTLVSVMESEDPNSRAGRLRRKMTYFLDSEESEVRGDYWKDTHERRRSQGRPHNGSARFGYMRCPECILVTEELKNGKVRRRYAKCKHCEGILVVDPARGPFAAEVMERWVTGEKISALAHEMYERGVRSLSGQRMDVSKWFAVLDSGFIAGLLRGRELPIKHPQYKKRYPTNRPEHYDRWQKGSHKALVKPDVWESYKRKRAGAAQKITREEARGAHSVSGLLICPNEDKAGHYCGGKHKAGTAYNRDKTRATMFNCRNAADDPKTCSGAAIRLSRVEADVLKWLEDQRTGESAALAEFQSQETADAAKARLTRIRPAMERVQKKLDALLDLKLEGGIDATTYERKQAELVAERDLYAQQIQDAESDANTGTAPHMETIGSLLDYWDDMKLSAKQKALRVVIREIRVHRTIRGLPSRTEIIPAWQPAARQSA